MVGQILPERQELKVGLLTKKSQNKSRFFTRDNYTERVFVLDSVYLTYYDGNLERRGSEKGSIQLREILAVETLLTKESNSGFQISYEEDGRPLILYIFAKSQQDRDEWIKAVRNHSLDSGAYFILTYHPSFWSKKNGFSCCGAPSRGDEGCMPVTNQTSEMRERLMSKGSSMGPGEIMTDIMSKRSQGKSKFFGVVNYKDRVFALDPRSLRYFEGNLKKREGLKGSIELCLVFAVEYVKDTFLDGRKNAFQVVYEDDDDERVTLVIVARSGDKRQAWVKAIREEARKSGAAFQAVYHPGIWVKGFGKYNCCGDTTKDSMGCEPVTVDVTVTDASDQAPSSAGRLLSASEVRVGMLSKRAQCKSAFSISKSYRDRLFVLNKTGLQYCHGNNKKRGDVRCRIPLMNISVVASVNENDLEGRRHGFQVVYTDEDDGKVYVLYVVAASAYEKHSWVKDISAECKTAGVELQPFCHPGVWTKSMGKFTCCGQGSREVKGCMTNDLDLLALSPSPSPRRASSSSSSSSSS